MGSEIHGNAPLLADEIASRNLMSPGHTIGNHATFLSGFQQQNNFQSNLLALQLLHELRSEGAPPQTGQSSDLRDSAGGSSSSSR